VDNIVKAKRTAQYTASLDTPISYDEEGAVLGDFIEDEDAVSPTRETFRELLIQEIRKALKERLTPRERRVLELRYGLDGNLPKTLDEVGEIFGISRERVRQIQKEALEKLRGSEVLQKLEKFRQVLGED